MVKVSITLPNNAQITFESEEPEVIHEVVGMVLRDLPRDLMQSAAVTANGNGNHQPDTKPANGAIAARSEASPPTSSPPDDSEAAEHSPVEETPAPYQKRPAASKRVATKPQSASSDLTSEERQFIQFCRETNPLGDMRRVVVAAEGASRYLDTESVDPDELGRLFDLVGWQRPHSFVQTLRNAARSKFRWLERVPGRSGHYIVTDLGRTTAFGS